MSKEINKVPATQTAPAKPRPKFGVRVSKDVPEFEVADQVFTTRMISITEELALVTASESLTTKADEEGGEPASAATANETLGDNVAGMLVLLLKPRWKKQAESDEVFEVTVGWVKDNMQTGDLTSLLHLLRTGHELPENVELAAEEAADPNADQ